MGEDKKTKKLDKKQTVVIIIAIIFLGALILFAGNDPLIDLFAEEEPDEVIEPPIFVKLDLDKIEILKDGNITNVELIFKNTGNETIANFTIYIRARNQNGTLLLSDNVNTTLTLIDPDDYITSFFSFPSGNATMIRYTIEVTWTGGRELFTGLTDL